MLKFRFSCGMSANHVYKVMQYPHDQFSIFMFLSETHKITFTLIVNNFLYFSSFYEDEWSWYLHMASPFSTDPETKKWVVLYLQDLDAVRGTGDKKLSELRTLGDKVALSTSERGGKALRATVTSMEDAWNQHLANVGE